MRGSGGRGFGRAPPGETFRVDGPAPSGHASMSAKPWPRSAAATQALAGARYWPSPGNTCEVEPDELGRDFGEALAASLRPAILDRYGAALDPAKLAQPLDESGNKQAPGHRRGCA